MPTREELQHSYSASSDREVRDALAAGRDAYTDEAWEILSDEVKRREIGASLEEVEESRPDPAAAVLAGEKQLRIVVIATLVLAAASAGLLLYSINAFALGAIRFAVILALCVKALEGRPWARWTLAVVGALDGLGSLATLVVVREPALPASVFFGLKGLVSLGATATLVFSRDLSAFFAEHRRIRQTQGTAAP